MLQINDTVRVCTGQIGTVVSQVYADPFDNEPTCLVKVEDSYGCCVAFGVADLEPVSSEQVWNELQAVPSYLEQQAEQTAAEWSAFSSVV